VVVLGEVLEGMEGGHSDVGGGIVDHGGHLAHPDFVFDLGKGSV
jgi:hypothetical protein